MFKNKKLNEKEEDVIPIFRIAYFLAKSGISNYKCEDLHLLI